MDLLFLSKLELNEKPSYIIFHKGSIFSLNIEHGFLSRKRKNNIEIMNFIISLLESQIFDLEEIEEYFDLYKFRNERNIFLKEFKNIMRFEGERRTVYANYRNEAIEIYIKSSKHPYFCLCEIK